MPVVIHGGGTIEGIAVGGLPDGIVDSDMMASGNNTGLRSQQVFTTVGTATWTKPTGINVVRVIVTAGGGGGGGYGAANDFGGAGGAGGTAIKIIDVSSISSIGVTVGYGGSAATSDIKDHGLSGGLSAFGAHCWSMPGCEAQDGNYGANTGGIGGTAFNGDINLRGGDGGCGFDNFYVPSGTNYSSALNAGGASYWGGGGRGSTYTTGAQSGKVYGSGGGGAHAKGDGSGAAAAGAGFQGIVVVEEYR